MLWFVPSGRRRFQIANTVPVCLTAGVETIVPRIAVPVLLLFLPAWDGVAVFALGLVLSRLQTDVNDLFGWGRGWRGQG